MTVSGEHRRTWTLFATASIVTLFGVQSMRAFLPLLVYVLRDRVGWGPEALGLIALAVFSAAFVSGPAARALGHRRLLMGSAGGLALLRVGLQIWSGDPVGELVLAGLACAFFVVALFAVLSPEPSEGGPAAGSAAAGLLFGLALDVGLHGTWGTWDLSWRGDPASLLAVAVPAALLLAILRWDRRAGPVRSTPGEGDFGGRSGGAARPLFVIGPLLALEMLLYLNIARLSALTGWSTDWSFLCILLAHVAGTVAVIGTWDRVVTIAAGTRRRAAGTGAAAVPALLLVAVTAVPDDVEGWAAAVPVAAGQVAAAYVMAAAVLRARRSAAEPEAGGGGSEEKGRGAGSWAYGLGMVGLVLLLFAYYAGFDLALPFPNSAVPVAGAVLAGFPLVLAAALRAAPSPGPSFGLAQSRVGRGAILVTALLLLLPGGRLASVEPAEQIGVSGEEGAELDRLSGDRLRIMTFNLHNGFDVTGHLGLEALARTIEEEDPHVVVLQEVSRGWVINGGVDMAEWMGRRLDMGYAYGPTTGALWGNALLSRVRLEDVSTHTLPSAGLPLQRGAIRADVPVFEGEPVRVIGTHLHHVSGEGHVRIDQLEALLGVWGQSGRTVIAGDLNAVPGDRETRVLRLQGLVDAWEEAGRGKGFTYPSPSPERRIDYLWVTPDLEVAQAATAPGTASDHVGVILVLDL